MAETMTCAAVREALPELALGVLVGSDRALVLAHLESCGQCSADLEELSKATDMILEIIPAVDPPAGFEVRLLQRRASQARARGDASAGQTRKSRPWRLRLLTAVAALALVGVGVAVGSLTSTGHGSNGHSTGVTTAALSSDGANRGTVGVYGNPAWVFMSVHDMAQSTWVRCVVTERDGRSVVVGHFLLSGSYGAWSARVAVPASDIVGARLESQSGATLATATFPA